jgi:hypothetical protein
VAEEAVAEDDVFHPTEGKVQALAAYEVPEP